MKIVYNCIVFFASLLLPVVAIFNKKIKLFVDGRKQTFSKIATLKNSKTIWFHAASLGEFEQAIPLIEVLKVTHAEYKILVTFFSPSGYEIRKHFKLADVVCYLPLDSRSNAKLFVETVNPAFAIFVKYEFWPNLLFELKRKEISTILVSGIFRKEQVFFKKYGGFMRVPLKSFAHFFVQDNSSKELLSSIHFDNVTVAGDTRFDRVSKILEQENTLDFINEFKDGKYTLVAGSTWKEDEVLLINYINNEASEDEKFIIAPHTIHPTSIVELQKSIDKKSVLYSEKSDYDVKESQVFIIDTIGLLTKIYAAADVAYVGGGLKTGLHNVLEPATFGIPVVIGNIISKFKEAVDLVELKGCISIENTEELTTVLRKLKTEDLYRKKTGGINKKYIQDHLGATQSIIKFINDKL
ncbi:3-deoxy-D-manno-octulosonic acid transferase [Polaribacter sp. HL-MS24]|uniref:3-deoxy-D-manno-octulosonic acid transferase n=1 Tax=Polaribacter sp. HL-MS24 TaxID=3077735 RepID=UPI002934C5A2|nr:glycosyltransferase N-terminal domain-containing protein [Polaribacter sp. HL-MS24]WOC40989.1 glycosyltransferase N-terminal domain-containing protein [Polaribacter sp. HL-MS24]